MPGISAGTSDPQSRFSESVSNSSEFNFALNSNWQSEGGDIQHQPHNDKPDPKTSVSDSDATTISPGNFAHQEPDPGHHVKESEDSILTNDCNGSRMSSKRNLACKVEAEEHGTQDKRRCYGLRSYTGA